MRHGVAQTRSNMIKRVFVLSTAIFASVTLTLTSCTTDEAITNPQNTATLAAATPRTVESEDVGIAWKGDGQGNNESPVDIQGIATDTAGVAISDASVQLVNLNEPYNVLNTTTDGNGNYAFEADPSAYTAHFTASGYLNYDVPEFELAQNTQMDVTMQPE